MRFEKFFIWHVADSHFAKCKHIKLFVKTSSQLWQKRKAESELEVRDVQDYCI